MQAALAIVGPTAVGKTTLSLRLAEELDGEIINADALQVYKGFDIGTDKPSPEVRRRVPHHLVDILEPDERYSAGEFARRARIVIAELERRGKVAILVGGSGLYLRALGEGLSPVPRDLEVRRQLRQRAESEGLAVLYEELGRLDAPTAARLEARDRQRILRALEVVLATGIPMSEWLRRPPAEDPLPMVRLGLTLPRSILYDRIAGRVYQMVQEGWVEEVKAMLERGIDLGAPAFQAIGYRQLSLYIRGTWSLEEAVENTIRATRRYARRQLTWFRKEKDVRWISALELASHEGRLSETLEIGGDFF